MNSTEQSILLAQYLAYREVDPDHASRADLWVFGALTLKEYLQKPLSAVEKICLDILTRSGWTEKRLASCMYSAKETHIMKVLAKKESPLVLVNAGKYIHSVVAECQPIPISSPSTPSWFNNMRASYIAY